MAGGRRSEPYAGNGPAGTPPVIGDAATAAGPPATTGATVVMPLSAVGGITGAEAGAAVFISEMCGTAADPVATAGAAAIGVVVGGAAGAKGSVAAWIVPSDNDCAPAAAGAPVIIPVVNDWLKD